MDWGVDKRNGYNQYMNNLSMQELGITTLLFWTHRQIVCLKSFSEWNGSVPVLRETSLWPPGMETRLQSSNDEKGWTYDCIAKVDFIWSVDYLERNTKPSPGPICSSIDNEVYLQINVSFSSLHSVPTLLCSISLVMFFVRSGTTN